MKVLLLGAGKIGRMITKMLQESGDFSLEVGDVDDAALGRLAQHTGVDTRLIDVTDRDALQDAVKDCDAVVSALSYRFNARVAEAALAGGVSYFDLTEDVETTRAVRRVADRAHPGQIFMPQCGLAPGFISIVAKSLSEQFDSVDRIHMRVGALPQFPTGEMKYNLTWSTDGLINEYCNPCEAIQSRRRVEVMALEGLEHFSLDGVRYEAFNTSGGLGTLCDTLDNQVRELNYKTVRYVGHRQMMAFLVNELRMNEKRELLKNILEESIPITFQDVVVTFCSVSGYRNGELVQMSDARKVYAGNLYGEHWSAIQLTTAAAICAVLDLHRQQQVPQSGFVRQEDVSLESFLNNRFGKIYESQISTRFSRS